MPIDAENRELIKLFESGHEQYLDKYLPSLEQLTDLVANENNPLIVQLLCNRLTRLAGELSNDINNLISY